MRPTAVPFAARFVNAWTRLYTVGLPPVVRERRRTEIEADLVDQVRQSAIEGKGASTELFLRFLSGISDDVAWRFNQQLSHRNRSAETSRPDVLSVRKVAVGGGTLVALLVIGAVFGTVENLQQRDFTYVPSWIAVVPFAVPFGLAMMVAGVSRMRKAPKPAAMLVSFGSAVVAIMFWWYVFPVVVAVAVSVYAFRIARQKERRS